ncbi:hypothetical protein [Sessilibacter corallicola]|uniref:hypothetical protein n=1 Tax=Sessilibacter corallicola TaxID=2904075 RepID=UPI003340D9B3
MEPSTTKTVRLDQITPASAQILHVAQGYLHITNIPKNFNYESFLLNTLELGQLLEQPGGDNSTLVKPEPNYENRSDSRTSGSIPPHTDGPWLNTPVGILALACHSPGEKVVPTCLHDMTRFITESLPLPLLNKALERPINWKSDFSDDVKSAPIFEGKNQKLITRYSQNMILLGESSPNLKRSQNAFTHSSCDDFSYCFAALYRDWSQKPQNQLHAYLQKGDLILFSNHRFTHEVEGNKSPSRCLERWFLSGEK